MNFSLLDNISLTCLTLDDNHVDLNVGEKSLDPSICNVDEIIDEDNPRAGLMKLSEEEIAGFTEEMESPTRSPAAVVNGLAISSRCSDVRPAVCSLKACTQLAASMCEELGRLGACACIVKIMETHGIESEVALQVFDCLIGLCQCPYNILLMERSGASVHIMKLWSVHRSNIDIMSLATAVILMYLKTDQLGGSILVDSLLNEGFFPELLGILDLKSPSSASAIVVENVCHALMMLCPKDSTKSSESNERLHPAINLDDAVIAVDGTANFVDFDGVPMNEQMRALLVQTREHFRAVLEQSMNKKVTANALLNSSSSSSLCSSKSSSEHISTAHVIRSKSMDIRVSKADLLHVVTTLLADLLKTSESKTDIRIHTFEDVFIPAYVRGSRGAESPAEKSPARLIVKQSRNVDKAKMLAFQRALTAVMSDDEDERKSDGAQAEQDNEILMPHEQQTVIEHNDIALEGTISPLYPLRAESHHSIRFDKPVSLCYKPNPQRPFKFQRSIGSDRSNGNLYFADLQYAMAMARCAAYFESLAHKVYVSPAGLDDSNSSIYSTSQIAHDAGGNRGKILSAKSLSRCVEKLRVAVSLDSEHVDALFALAVLILEQDISSGHLEEAEMLFKDVIVLHPEYPKCYYNLGHVFFSKGQYGDSLECFESAIAIDALDMEAKVYRALCLTKMGTKKDICEAMNEYRSIINLDSSNYLALYNLGALLAKMEDYSGAIFTFQNILMNDPENIDVLSVLAKSFQLRAEQSIITLKRRWPLIR